MLSPENRLLRPALELIERKKVSTGRVVDLDAVLDTQIGATEQAKRQKNAAEGVSREEYLNSFVWDEETQQLHWLGEDFDKEIIEKVCEIIAYDRNDEQFELQKSEIVTLLKQSRLFQLLDDPELTVSAAHRGKTPYKHTIDVLFDRTDGLEKAAIRTNRLAKLFHDVAKIFGADGIDSQYHAFISSLIAKQFKDIILKIIPYEYSVALILAIEHHHIYEEVSFEFYTLKELQQIFSIEDPENVHSVLILFLLWQSDIWSIEAYRKFIDGAYDFLKKVDPNSAQVVLERGLVRRTEATRKKEMLEKIQILSETCALFFKNLRFYLTTNQESYLLLLTEQAEKMEFFMRKLTFQADGCDVNLSEYVLPYLRSPKTTSLYTEIERLSETEFARMGLASLLKRDTMQLLHRLVIQSETDVKSKQILKSLEKACWNLFCHDYQPRFDVSVEEMMLKTIEIPDLSALPEFT